MNIPPSNRSEQSPEANTKSILEWLALAHSSQEVCDPEQLFRQLLLLRETPMSAKQSVKLLDLLYFQAERLVAAERPALRDVSLPISRRLRQRVRSILKTLEILAQDYLKTVSGLLDPRGGSPMRAPEITLKRILRCLTSLQHVSNLIAAPNPPGLWQQIHAAFAIARRLGITEISGPGNEATILRIYSRALLTAVAQPASFSAEEQELIAYCVERIGPQLLLTATPPADYQGAFWIDLDKDIPAHPLGRRPTSQDNGILFFSCADIAEQVGTLLGQLNRGVAAVSLGLPSFADTRAGKGVLRRLISLWGNPGKRKFPRRRQSYRTQLCVGFGNIWRLLDDPTGENELSEWMVINESPDGYAVMHMSGHTHRLRVGDIIAIRPTGEHAENKPVWHICIVRWALSENPEHMELGLQSLASHAIAAYVVRPETCDPRKLPALILPEAPPMRPQQALVVQTGSLGDEAGRLVVLVDKENLGIREIQAGNVTEQTGRIEVFSVETAESD